jgi:hypothetical protein
MKYKFSNKFIIITKNKKFFQKNKKFFQKNENFFLSNILIFLKKILLVNLIIKLTGIFKILISDFLKFN